MHLQALHQPMQPDRQSPRAAWHTASFNTWMRVSGDPAGSPRHSALVQDAVRLAWDSSGEPRPAL